MRKKLLFLALVLAFAFATAITATSRISKTAFTCPPGSHRLVCGEDVYCCPSICICP
jgi:hypothetical protein